MTKEVRDALIRSVQAEIDAIRIWLASFPSKSFSYSRNEEARQIREQSIQERLDFASKSLIWNERISNLEARVEKST